MPPVKATNQKYRVEKPYDGEQPTEYDCKMLLEIAMNETVNAKRAEVYGHEQRLRAENAEAIINELRHQIFELQEQKAIQSEATRYYSNESKVLTAVCEDQEKKIKILQEKVDELRQMNTIARNIAVEAHHQHEVNGAETTRMIEWYATNNKRFRDALDLVIREQERLHRVVSPLFKI